jgi:Cu+-exporting ATPase
MPKTPFSSAIWFLFMILAAAFLILAHLAEQPTASGAPHAVDLFGRYSALFFGMFSAIFCLLGLSSSLNSTAGRPLTLLTASVSVSLLGTTLVLHQAGTPPETANTPAVAAAWLMVLRAAGVAILPPRGDRSGVTEAVRFLVLGVGAAGLWWLLARWGLRTPTAAPAALAATLLLAWPTLIDGINAFADEVFHKAARASGARELAPGAFTRIARARDILIDKAAVMSGPELMVTNVMAFDNEPKTLLAVAASAEAGSSHPVALALRELASQWRVELRMPDRFDPAPGLGVVALLGGQTVVIGTTDLLKSLRIDSFTADAIARSLEEDGKTVLRVAVGGKVVGVLGLEGTLRQDAGVAGLALRREGLVPWLCSGDSPKTRAALAGMLGLELPDAPRPGETVQEAAIRSFPSAAPLVLTLSADRRSLELRDCLPAAGAEPDGGPEPLAVSDTDDIGAFPALKALAMRRTFLALHARRVLTALWTLAGLCGALGARFSVAGTFHGRA